MIKFQGKVKFYMFLKSSKNAPKKRHKIPDILVQKLKKFGLFPDIFYGCLIQSNKNTVTYRVIPDIFDTLITI